MRIWLQNHTTLSFAAVFLLLPSAAMAQGFGGLGGMKKAKEAPLKRILPASVNLNQKRIKVNAVGVSKSIPEELLVILRTKLVTSIQKDNRFIVDDRNPETLLNFSVTNYYVERYTTQATQTSPAATCYTGKIEASYQAVEVGTDAPLDSENLVYAITREGPKKSSGLGGIMHKSVMGGCSGHTKPSENETRDELVDGIVMQMSSRAAPFEETLSVPVPGGKLEPLASLAITQRWSKLLEDAEKAEHLPKPEDDAYRVYMIGLANEALAYQDAKDAAELEKGRRGDVNSAKAKQAIAQEEKDFNEAQAYLDKAAKAYQDALQGKPAEKEFREPNGRMEEAVKLYATINRHKLEYQEAVEKKNKEHQTTLSASASGSTRSIGDPGPQAPTAAPYTQIIGMCQDHVPDIGQLIHDHSTELHFDKGLSLAEELKLKKECGGESKGILQEIKAQVTKTPVPAPKTPASTSTRK